MLSSEILLQLYPRAPRDHLAAFASGAGGLLGRFGITGNERRLTFFLAQIGHESGGLTITEENLRYRAERIVQVWPGRFASVGAARPFADNPRKLANQVYANRMGNGSPESGDGFRYRGRGYVQITGRDAYRHVGRQAGLDLEGSPDLAAAPEHALRVACAVWAWKGLNPVCDAGDFTAVTRRINGGTVGLADRRAWLDKVRRTLARPPAPEEQPPAADAVAIQRALQARGFREVGAADGIVGPRTVAAVARFRQENGLPPGLMDGGLRAALGLLPT